MYIFEFSVGLNASMLLYLMLDDNELRKKMFIM